MVIRRHSDRPVESLSLDELSAAVRAVKRAARGRDFEVWDAEQKERTREALVFLKLI